MLNTIKVEYENTAPSAVATADIRRKIDALLKDLRIKPHVGGRIWFQCQLICPARMTINGKRVG